MELTQALLQGLFRETIYAPYKTVFVDKKWYVHIWIDTVSKNPNEAYVSNYLLKLNTCLLDKTEIILSMSSDMKSIHAYEIVQQSGNEIYTAYKWTHYLFCSCYLIHCFDQPIQHGSYSCFTSHVKLPPHQPWFYVAKSKIEGGGWGLFSHTTFFRGDRLLSFKGKQWDELSFEKHYPNSKDAANEYSMMAQTYDNKNIIFDPTEENVFNIHVAKRTQNFAPFINEPGQGQIANAETVSVSSKKIALRVDVVATCYIQPHDEIYMLYLRNDKAEYKIGDACPIPLVLPFRVCFYKPILLCIGFYDYELLHWQDKYHVYVNVESLVWPMIKYPNDISEAISLRIKINEHNSSELDNILTNWFFCKHVTCLYVKESQKVLNWITSQSGIQYKHVDGEFIVSKLPYEKTLFPTYTSETIVQNKLLSDTETLLWIQKYGTNLDKISHVEYIQNKPNTKIYLLSIRK